MKIGIVGAGYTGLTAGLRLAKSGHKVVIFDREGKAGGLAIGFKDEKWEWSLEKHYHHIFTSDYEIQKIAQEVGAKFFFESPKTSTWINQRIWQVDSPINLLKFGALSGVARIKTGLGMAFLKLTSDWKSLEKTTSALWLRKLDNESFEVLWKPLLLGKFGELYDKINAAWFWARIKKRSMKLGYFDGGFEALAKRIESAAIDVGVEFKYGASVESITQSSKATAKSNFIIKFANDKRGEVFDKVLVTGPSWVLAKIVPQLPYGYKKKLFSYKGLGAVNVVLALNQRFLADGTYWLNINEPNYPFLAVVEHTNFIGSQHYGGDKLVYIGNYLPASHEYFNLSEDALVSRFMPYLKKINPEFKKEWIRKGWVFKAPFAQPVVDVNYSKKLLPFQTPIEGLYWGSIQQVYPWDRGTNYAVEMGVKIAKLMINDSAEKPDEYLTARK